MTVRRLSTGGRINRNKPVSMQFDGRDIPAFEGDTLASALLASDTAMVARSFKYHRPRGIMSAGVEEPNALLQLGTGALSDPNTPATTTEAAAGLTAFSQNAWPSLKWDVGQVNGLLSRFLGAGFYYKTFIGPFAGTRFWMMCETVIRRAAGMGRASMEADPDHYEKTNAHCDLLVVGGGPAGLAAALAAAQDGKDVILVEQDFALGGAILDDKTDASSADWLDTTKTKLCQLPNVRILTRTTAFGAYDGNIWGLVERIPHSGQRKQPRQRYWLVRTKHAALATGTLERPLVFGGNDKPGVMLAGAARSYLNRYSVQCGQHIVICTNNDSAHRVAHDLAKSGAEVTLCDMRASLPDALINHAKSAGVTLLLGTGVVGTKGRTRVTGVAIAKIGADGNAVEATRDIPCDLVAMSGGWTPALHLWSQRFGKPEYNADLDTFTPALRDDVTCVGSITGTTGTANCIGQALTAMGTAPELTAIDDDTFAWPRDLLHLHIICDQNGNTLGKAFVDFQHDVKLSDIDQAHREGYVSVEHLKRYTTSGMAADQGKTSNLNALARLAALQGLDVPSVGTTTFRPPYTPVAIGAIVGHDHGLHFAPTRLSPIHDWHVENGAVMIEAGAWLRPWYYPHGDEDLRSAYAREAAHVREHVGIVDVSTLGKIAMQGPDATELLNRLYVNGFKTLAIGRLRYGVMLREDGFVLDDGAVARLGEFDYFISTTTANAAKILARIEFLLQAEWRDLRCHVTTVTDQWAAIAIAGPKSRTVLQQLCPDSDLSRDALPNNHFTYVTIAGANCRLHRMSYSGELAYEIYCPAGAATDVWETLIASGAAYNLQPYGTEAMGTLRIEKGHVAGAEIEGRTTLRDLGLEGFASSKKPFVGAVLRNRPHLTDPARPVLVGLKINGGIGAKPGALLFPKDHPIQGHGDGWVSSTTWSPALECNIALGFLANGADRHGEIIQVASPVDRLNLSAEVVSTHFFDPRGVRQNG